MLTLPDCQQEKVILSLKQEQIMEFLIYDFKAQNHGMLLTSRINLNHVSLLLKEN